MGDFHRVGVERQTPRAQATDGDKSAGAIVDFKEKILTLLGCHCGVLLF